MNDLLRNLIETGDIAVFINDVMIRKETEEGHNDIIEEILRRMAENYLFVKPEKFNLCGRLENSDKTRWSKNRKAKYSENSRLAST